MHIHPLKGKLDSVKEFFLELFTITCGILIALSLEGTVEWVHHRHLLHEARGNILSELQENRRTIASTAKEIPAELGNLQRMMSFCRQERSHRGSVDLDTAKKNVSLNFTTGTISATSWSTAQSAGAINLMDYEEINRYTIIYALQTETAALARQTLDKWLQVQRVGGLLTGRPNLKDLSDSDIADIERSASEAFSYTSALQGMEQSLEAQYVKLMDSPKK